MEIAIAGEGELVIRFIDKTGQALMQERLVVSGAPTMEARHVTALSLQTVNGLTPVAPVLVRRSNPKQRVTFDRETPARFARKRCKEIGGSAKIAADAARGEVPPLEPGNGPFLTSDAAALDRLIASAARSRRR
jgi:hypothetical protein